MSIHSELNWRDTGREPKFIIFDWKLILPLVILPFQLFNLKIYIIFILMLAMSFYLNYIGYTSKNFKRLIQLKIIGKKINGKPKWFQRKYF